MVFSKSRTWKSDASDGNEESSKQDAPERIHPSDKKYNEALKKGQFMNLLFFQARITRISSFTIRTAKVQLSQKGLW